MTEGSSGLRRGRARFAHPAEDLLDSSCRGQGIRGGGPPRWQLPWALHLGGSWGSRLWWRLEGGLSAGWVRSLGWLLANLATGLFPQPAGKPPRLKRIIGWEGVCANYV